MSDAAKKLDDPVPDVPIENVTRRAYRKREARVVRVKDSKTELLALIEENDRLEREDPLPPRPKTRADCVDGPRPCPWVGCKFNTYLEITSAGGISLSFPSREPDEVDPDWSCALDVAERREHTLQEIGEAMHVSRERIRQIEEKAVDRAKREMRRAGLQTSEGFVSRGDSPLAEIMTGSGGTGLVANDEDDEEEVEDVAPRRLFTGDKESDAQSDADWTWERLERRRKHREVLASGDAAALRFQAEAARHDRGDDSPDAVRVPAERGNAPPVPVHGARGVEGRAARGGSETSSVRPDPRPDEADPDAAHVPEVRGAPHRRGGVRDEAASHARVPVVRDGVEAGDRGHGGGEVPPRLQERDVSGAEAAKDAPATGDGLGVAVRGVRATARRGRAEDGCVVRRLHPEQREPRALREVRARPRAKSSARPLSIEEAIRVAIERALARA